jgi:glutathione S-transferase
MVSFTSFGARGGRFGLFCWIASTIAWMSSSCACLMRAWAPVICISWRMSSALALGRAGAGAAGAGRTASIESTRAMARRFTAHLLLRAAAAPPRGGPSHVAIGRRQDPRPGGPAPSGLKADPWTATLGGVPTDAADRCALYYWPGLQGRGEFVRLVLEDAGVPYVDVGRLPEDQGGGIPAILRLLQGEAGRPLPFAPPILAFGDRLLWQTAHICHWLGRRFGLAPSDEQDALAALALELTLADCVTEAHDAHHPVGGALYYEEQKAESARRAKLFREERMPRFLTYFEQVLERNGRGGDPVLVGSAVSHVDLSAYQVLEGLAYAFPNAFSRLEQRIPRLLALRERVAARPRIAAYLASERRTPFNETGIFRHYPELDPE